ncbi:MAG: type IV pili methyl-accepting chemotaxis transducer N-terminal domain-containing protein, partial [Chloroflexi bacterium]|nr:type IV pili methyl-accepting chemotaxis transducer N-terminal domain-containing protein [Chloroflexota bacterium]
MLRSIRTNLGLVLGLLIFIGLLSVGTTLWAVGSQSADALVINLAGRQRMLTQRLAKLVFLSLQQRALSTKGGQAPDYQPEIEATEKECDQIFQALRDGGQVVYEGRTVSLPPTTDPTIRAQLERAMSLRETFHSAAHNVLENPPESRGGVTPPLQGLADVESLSESIVKEMDRAVQLYEAAAAARVARVEQIQLVFLFAGAIIVAFGFGLTHWQIIRPLAVLGTAVGRVSAGDLISPVPAMAQNEIGVVAATLDAMRQRLWQHIAEQAALLKLSQGLVGLLDPDAILDRAAETAQEIFRPTLVSLMLPDESRQNLILCAGRGWESELYGVYSVDLATSREGYAFVNGEAVWLEDVQ